MLLLQKTGSPLALLLLAIPLASLLKHFASLLPIVFVAVASSTDQRALYSASLVTIRSVITLACLAVNANVYLVGLQLIAIATVLCVLDAMLKVANARLPIDAG